MTHRGGLATLALKAVDNPLEFGIVITREDGSIERFLEKPTWGQVFSDTINTGIYVLEPEIFDFIPEGQPVDFSGESFPEALAAGKPLFGYVADGYWEDVGTLEAYLKVPSGHPRSTGAGGHQRLPAPSPGVAGQGGRDRSQRGHRRSCGDR